MTDAEKALAFARDLELLSGNANLVCPFCGDEGYDKIGLKNHLLSNCTAFREVEDLSSVDLFSIIGGKNNAKKWRMYGEDEGCPECGSIPEVMIPAEGDSVRCPVCDTRGSVEADGSISWED